METQIYQAKNLVNGEFFSSANGDVLEVANPASTEIIGTVPSMRSGDLIRVFDAAAAGSKVWKRTGVLERARILYRTAELIRAASSELTNLIVAEMGKTAQEAAGEVAKSAEFFEFYAATSRLPFGELVSDARPGTFATQIREPLGIVVLVTPWNDPLLTPARKLAPALISGNAVVIKPASDTPLILLRLAELIHEAGLPAGVLGTVTGRGAEIGDALFSDSRIKAVSFTGSTAVGRQLQKDLAGRPVRIQTEMGGKNALVVMDDADLDLAVAAIMAGSFGQAGQRCTATSRLLVHSQIAATLRTRLSDAIGSLKVGAGSEPGVHVGPVINPRAAKTINTQVDEALQDGARLLATAPVPPGASSAFVAPKLLEISRGSRLWSDELFGPILGLVEVADLDEAITAVNESDYGLSAAIFTRSLEHAFRFVDEVDTGQVSVNQPTSGWDIHHPFGGFKDSGSAFKEQGLEALRFYTKVKTSAIRTHRA